MKINDWVRPNILNMKPYSSARGEFPGEAQVFLDANENPYNEPYNRYPDPLQLELKRKIAVLKGVPHDCIFLGNGSDEPIDLIIRLFCEPGIHNIVMFEPTYGMYEVAAEINNVEVRKVKLSASYGLDSGELLKAVNPETRVIFLCSPNNPTGNAMQPDSIKEVLSGFDGIVVLDEAYIDFASDLSWLPRLNDFPNLIILQTFSKAWGMAGIRLGMAFCQHEIVGFLNKIKYPYNLNVLTQRKALELLENSGEKENWVRLLLEERGKMAKLLANLPFVTKVFPSDSNFLLVKMKNAREVYRFLVNQGIVVRDRSKVALCENSLRITVGAPEENQILFCTLNDYSDQINKE